MKTLKIFSIVLLCCTLTTASFAQKNLSKGGQAKTEKFNVSGNCGMCETKIEKAAKDAGATFAEWDKDTKILTVKYYSTSSNLAKIQKSIAESGYDNAGVKTTTEAYDKLHACCKYERTESSPAKGGADKMECCKDGKCSKEGHDGKNCCKESAEKMDCCKDGKCTKEGHDGKDCCKKEGVVKMDCCKESECCKKS